MEKLDLLNSFDVLSIARRWPLANEHALDLASRVSTNAEIQAERDRIGSAIPLFQSRKRFWTRVAFLGYGVVVVDALLMALAVVGGSDLVAPVQVYPGPLTPKVVAILGTLWWILMMNLTVSPREAVEGLRAKLALLQPVSDGQACVAVAQYISTGRPEVLAWRDIALYDREVLFSFDVGVLQALHHVSMAARSAAEKEADAAAAQKQLYGAPRLATAEGADHVA